MAYYKNESAHLLRIYVILHLIQQIRVNSVNPTVVLTAMGKMAWSDPVKSNLALARIPLGRFAGNLPLVNNHFYDPYYIKHCHCPYRGG